MQDRVSLGNALQDRFAWPELPTLVSEDRKIFDKACETWRTYQSRTQLPSPADGPATYAFESVPPSPDVSTAS